MYFVVSRVIRKINFFGSLRKNFGNENCRKRFETFSAEFWISEIFGNRQNCRKSLNFFVKSLEIDVFTSDHECMQITPLGYWDLGRGGSFPVKILYLLNRVSNLAMSWIYQLFVEGQFYTYNFANRAEIYNLANQHWL